ncbi:hypothetical protein [Cohnella thailandensis]|uniref:Uncharacterized protein n=1 Tax=Cohnella thailandensis TaxID=557557 RepID=A0A841T552_9BACL|nr:hypothetical protein [Cohnella thailandensis]MBB6637448.1 hypothetical protein [Cohnella thailandensis]MBP1977824.1 hypothetical protein [Cohnella thailandensis]
MTERISDWIGQDVRADWAGKKAGGERAYEWETVGLAQGETAIGAAAVLGATASDGAEIAVRFGEPSWREDGRLRLQTVELRVSAPATAGDAGSAGAELAGVLLSLPVDESLVCVWKPHLAPLEGMAIGDRAFRSPAIVFEDAERMTALVPDLRSVERDRALPHVMDYVKQGHRVLYGLCDYEETGHVYHRLAPRSVPIGAESDGEISARFYLASWRKEPGGRARDLRRVERLLWELFGEERMGDFHSLHPHKWETYVRHAYGWAFDRWQDVTWQQFELDGREVGGVAFLVTAPQKPGLGSEEKWREPKSLWNQAWFSGLRSAYGYASWGRKFGREDWIAKAELALSFALAAPQTNGLFPGYFRAGDDNRWESGRWYMSAPRRPQNHEDYVHLLDASWTCYWLLKWHRDIREDERILPYVLAYAETLLGLQRADGSFPAWVRPDTLEASAYLTESPETSAHVMLLCLLHSAFPDPRWLEAAAKAGRFVAYRIVPFGRWEDFETYWSCSREWEGKKYGERDERSGLYNQCNFGLYWTAEAFKELFAATGEKEWLDLGEQTLAEASLYQQIWEPPYFPVPTLGGFGVMTSDDEWNDARQSLFALTYLDYAVLTGNPTYLARAYQAMRSSFYMMYCPENPEVKLMYERVHPHFDERDYGFHMENFNHHDGTSVQGLGEFTIFDWGCGAASTSLAQFESLWDATLLAVDLWRTEQ